MCVTHTYSKMKGFDYAGTVVFIVFAGAVLMTINRGNDLGWTSTPILTYAAVALATLPVLICVENRASHPILPFRLFRCGNCCGFWLKCFLLCVCPEPVLVNWSLRFSHETSLFEQFIFLNDPRQARDKHGKS